MKKIGGALLLSMGVALGGCGSDVNDGADAGCDGGYTPECCGQTATRQGLCGTYSVATCGPDGWTCPNGTELAPACSGLCFGTGDDAGDDVSESDGGADDGSEASGDESDDGGNAPSDDEGDAGVTGDAQAYCGNFFADPDAGADASSRMLTPEDVACTTTADCIVQACGTCSCAAIAFGVNKASTFVCTVLSCPAPPLGCVPSVWPQDCRSVPAIADVGVACVNGECLTLASPSDASAPRDASADAAPDGLAAGGAGGGK